MSDPQTRDRLARFLRDDLRRAAAEQAPLSETQIEAYVDGTLDDVDREIVESRLADDEALRAEVDALRELRAALSTAAPRVVPFVARPRRWTLGAAAGLAAAAVIALLVWRGNGAAPPPPTVASGGSGSGSGPSVGAAPPASPAEPAVVERLADRDRQIGLTADGRLSGADGVPPDVATRVATMLQERQLPPSRLGARVASSAGQLMSGDAGAAAFRPLGPTATAVLTARPTFRWTALRGAGGYRVRVVDERLRTITESPRLTTLTWQPPAALPAGTVLSWQVEADTADGPRTTPAPPLPEARFAVLPAAEAARVEAALRAVPSDLAAAVIAAEAGLYDDADAALRRLAAANPTSERVRALAADVTRLRTGR